MSEKRKSKFLKNVRIHTSRMYQRNTAYATILVWRVTDYEELQHNVMHFYPYESENFKFVFRLFKFNRTLHLSLTSDMFKDIYAHFSILDEVNQKSITEKAYIVTNGIFVSKFFYEEFLFPYSKFVLNGNLTIEFKYLSDYYMMYRHVPCENEEFLTDFDELSYHFKSMYLDALFPDFLIHVTEYTFKSHKLVLTGRSKYFFKLLENDKNKKEHRLPDDVMPGILHKVLLYIYSGELMELDEDYMLQIYEMAIFLEINALQKRCLKYFKTELKLSNYKKFCEFAVKFELIELKNIIIHAFIKFPELKIINVFKEIEEKNSADRIGGKETTRKKLKIL